MLAGGCQDDGPAQAGQDAGPGDALRFRDSAGDVRDSAPQDGDTSPGEDGRPARDWAGEAAPPPAVQLPGLYHLYPVGIVSSPSEVFSYESCGQGYEYTAIVRLHDQLPCLGALHINANAWVAGEPQADTVHALMAKGPLDGAELKASWFRSWTANGWEPYDDTVSHAAAARYPDGSGAFSLYYEVATPPAEYPYEYGQLYLAGAGDALSGLWRHSEAEAYYLAAMASATGEATFMRLAAAEGQSYFEIGYGRSSGDQLYAEAVWMLDHDGVWQQTLIEGAALQYRFDVSTGEFREWWSGSETAPNATSSFVRELDSSCGLSHDFGTCNCADPQALCASPLCQSCGPWLPPR